MHPRKASRNDHLWIALIQSCNQTQARIRLCSTQQLSHRSGFEQQTTKGNGIVPLSYPIHVCRFCLPVVPLVSAKRCSRSLVKGGDATLWRPLSVTTSFFYCVICSFYWSSPQTPFSFSLARSLSRLISIDPSSFLSHRVIAGLWLRIEKKGSRVRQDNLNR